MTYTVSSGTLNPSIPYHLVGSRMLSEISQEISDIVAELYNKSLTAGDVPQDWKLANVTAVYKKGKKRAHLTIDRLV